MRPSSLASEGASALPRHDHVFDPPRRSAAERWPWAGILRHAAPPPPHLEWHNAHYLSGAIGRKLDSGGPTSQSGGGGGGGAVAGVVGAGAGAGARAGAGAGAEAGARLRAGVEATIDLRVVRQLMTKAAAGPRGDRSAMTRAGLMAEQGVGGPVDRTAAKALFLRAAGQVGHCSPPLPSPPLWQRHRHLDLRRDLQGSREAACCVGAICYVDGLELGGKDGKGEADSRAEFLAAKHHWEAAASQQHPRATGYLSLLYAHAHGVERDLARAAHQLAAASVLGDGWSTERLGLLDKGIRQHCPLLGSQVVVTNTSPLGPGRDRNGKIGQVTNYDIDSAKYVVQLVEGGVIAQAPVMLAPNKVRARVSEA